MVIAIDHRVDPRPAQFQLSYERGRISDRGNRRHALTAKRRECGVFRVFRVLDADQLVRGKMNRYSRDPWHDRRQRGVDQSNRVGRRSLSSYDDQIGAPQGGQRLSPWPSREQPYVARPPIGADQHDVRGSVQLPMLKRIVEHRDIVASTRGRSHRTASVGIENHVDVGIERSMDRRLIAPVPAQNHRGMRSVVAEPSRDPRGDRCLSRSADGEIPDAHDRNGRSPSRRPSGIIHERPKPGQAGEQPLGWCERDACRARQTVGSVPDAFHCRATRPSGDGRRRSTKKAAPSSRPRPVTSRR